MKYKVTLNNRVYEVEVEEGQAMLIDEYELAAPAAPAAPAPVVQAAAPVAAAAPAAPAAPAGAGEKVNSPLPGVIVEVCVKEGQAVKAGQKVAVLEAMKMENEIPAPKDGTITAIHVAKGDSILEGAPVVTIA